MKRTKRPTEEAAGHERWLVSYADFITLLFAFFVVMFASSQADKGKAEQMSAAVKDALEGSHTAALVQAVLGGAVGQKEKGNLMMKGPGGAEKANPQTVVELQPSLDALRKDLQGDIDSGRIRISMQQRGLVVSLAEAAFFPSGHDDMAAGAAETIERIAASLRGLPNHLRMEGHTDSRPIHGGRFRSNWELSAARAIAVRDLFESRGNIPAGRMSVAGYGETAPVAENDSDEGRARNRRVDVVVLNQKASVAEPIAEANGKVAGEVDAKVDGRRASARPAEKTPPTRR